MPYLNSVLFTGLNNSYLFILFCTVVQSQHCACTSLHLFWLFPSMNAYLNAYCVRLYQTGWILVDWRAKIDNQRIEANWTTCVAFYKKCCIPLPPPKPIQKGNELEHFSTQYIHYPHNKKTHLFSSNRSPWVPKNAEFYADSKYEGKIEKSAQIKKLS